MSTFSQKIKARYTIKVAPRWNKDKVENILKSHAPLTDGDMQELHKALDYYEYLNNTLDDDQLDAVTEQLERIAERMEESGRLSPSDKEEHVHQH